MNQTLIEHSFACGGSITSAIPNHVGENRCGRMYISTFLCSLDNTTTENFYKIGYFICPSNAVNIESCFSEKAKLDFGR